MFPLRIRSGLRSRDFFYMQFLHSAPCIFACFMQKSLFILPHKHTVLFAFHA